MKLGNVSLVERLEMLLLSWCKFRVGKPRKQNSEGARGDSILQ